MSRSPASDARVAALTVVAIARVRYILWEGGFPAAQARYGLEAVTGSPAGEPRRAEWPEPTVLGVALRVLRTPVLGGACLANSIALASVLERLGIGADVVLGVAGSSPDFAAHAWVEAGGRRIDVSRIPPGSFAEIARFRAVRQLVRA